MLLLRAVLGRNNDERLLVIVPTMFFLPSLIYHCIIPLALGRSSALERLAALDHLIKKGCLGTIGQLLPVEENAAIISKLPFA